MEIKIKEDIKERLDKYLPTILKDYTRSQIQNMIKDKKILVNNLETNQKYELKENDIIYIDEKKEESYLEKKNLNLDIIYQDNDIAIINKPKGLVVHPASTYKKETLVNGLLYQLDNLSGINGIIRPGIVHRIDKDTTGLLIIAKNDIAHKKLSEDLKEHKIKRSYLALVHGVMPHDQGRIDAPIGRNINNRKEMDINPKGKKAITNFKVLKRYEKYTLIECNLETGRTHQIRVHMKYINYPIVGDTVYGIKDEYNKYNQLLHAYKLEFIHPITNKHLIFEIPLPEYFQNILNHIS